MRRTLVALAALVAVLAAVPAGATRAAPAAATRTFVAEVWADNWFALYANGKLVGKDSIPITTERSFNSEKITFKASYPLTIGILARDYMQDASGLEYIGTPRQQMGDGGLIAQVRDGATGKVVASTNGRWKAYALQRAPLNPSCVTSSQPLVDCKSETRAVPVRWATASFNDSAWARASVYSAAAVGVKDGYYDVTWSPAARLLWGADLHVDNVLLLRSPPVR
jgi:hypothetical protein